MVVAGRNVWGVGERERGVEESKRARGTTLGEKKNEKERRERDEREGDAEFRFPPAAVPVRSTEEGVNSRRGGMDDAAGGV